ncbi:hypothetical protein LG3211_4403 [Lysobacter gummosus]|nr:hypothetical protein LG3211_4403 [Lysobacter gummosus]
MGAAGQSQPRWCDPPPAGDELGPRPPRPVQCRPRSVSKTGNK